MIPLSDRQHGQDLFRPARLQPGAPQGGAVDLGNLEYRPLPLYPVPGDGAEITFQPVDGLHRAEDPEGWKQPDPGAEKPEKAADMVEVGVA